jgi:phage baseplate assembly protein W
MFLNFPYNINSKGKTSTVNNINEYIKQLLEQLLFTIPGERVNRPSFGTGIRQLVFSPNSDEIVSVTKALIQGNLQNWLSDYIIVEEVDTKNIESSLFVTIKYIVKSTNEELTISYKKEI